MLRMERPSSTFRWLGFLWPGDKDDDDDDDADEKMQSSGIPNGGHIRQESQEQSEVDHGDFEMVVSRAGEGKGASKSPLTLIQ